MIPYFFWRKIKIEFVFDMYGVPQKKFSLFWEHVTFHNLCLLQGIFVKGMFLTNCKVSLNHHNQVKDHNWSQNLSIFLNRASHHVPKSEDILALYWFKTAHRQSFHICLLCVCILPEQEDRNAKSRNVNPNTHTKLQSHNGKEKSFFGRIW